MKNILILTSSFRPNSQSSALAAEFARGAKEAGHSVESINLAGKQLNFCTGCLSCQRTQHCVFQDEAADIVDKIEKADVLVLATPIYFYELSGQLKTLLDRTNPLYTRDYAFREVYLIAAAAEDGEDVWQKTAGGLQGWVDCFEKAHFAGTLFAGNTADYPDPAAHPAMKTAYLAGKAVR